MANYLMRTGWKLFVSWISWDEELRPQWITLPKKIINISCTIVVCIIFENYVTCLIWSDDIVRNDVSPRWAFLVAWLVAESPDSVVAKFAGGDTTPIDVSSLIKLFKNCVKKRCYSLELDKLTYNYCVHYFQETCCLFTRLFCFTVSNVSHNRCDFETL
jgi:hypothetical protein